MRRQPVPCQLRPALTLLDGVSEAFHPDAEKHVDQLVRLLPELGQLDVPMFVVHLAPKVDEEVSGRRSSQEPLVLPESLCKRLARCCRGILPTYPRPPYDSVFHLAYGPRQMTLRCSPIENRAFTLLITRAGDPRAQNKMWRDAKRAYREAYGSSCTRRRPRRYA